MPFKRKTLTELREQNQNFLRNELKEPGALLRYSNMRVLADMDAGMAHLHYAYLDYIAKQATPFTATDEYLAGWGALKRVYRKPPNKATGTKVQFDGVPGSIIPAGTAMAGGMDTGTSLLLRPILILTEKASHLLKPFCPALTIIFTAAARRVTHRPGQN